MSKVIDLTKEDYKEKTKEGVCIVDFWAPWCGPCKVIAPVIDELATEYEGKVSFFKVNTDDQADLASQEGIASVPSLFIYKDGEKVDTLVGALPKAAIAAKLKTLL
jgi:thioredoxin 1